MPQQNVEHLDYENESSSSAGSFEAWLTNLKLETLKQGNHIKRGELNHQLHSSNIKVNACMHHGRWIWFRIV
jgi:hypothetical protein